MIRLQHPQVQQSPLRVAVLAESDLLVAGLTALLEPYADRVALVAATSREPLPDIEVLLYDPYAAADRRRPAGRGQRELRRFELLRLVRLARSRDASPVVFSWNAEATAVEHAFAAGAAGCVSKRAPAGEIVAALEAARAGAATMVASATHLDERPPGSPTDELSAREIQVLALIAQGCTNDQIAQRCFLSINTVKTHVRTAYRKIGVTRRSQAVLWGLRDESGASRPIDTRAPIISESVRRRGNPQRRGIPKGGVDAST